MHFKWRVSFAGFLSKTPILGLAVLLAASFVPFDARAMSSSECDVWAREMAFAQSVAQHDAVAFASFLHAGAVFSAATDAPVRGRAAIVEDWRPFLSGEIGLRWRAHFVSIGANPNIAISRGPYLLERPAANGRPASYAVGTFTSIWARADANAPWLSVFDGGGPAPTAVASLAEGEAFLNTAPLSCPGDSVAHAGQ